ncbi:hypothetical protein [Leptolinea tardivitalis]|uniref:Uncharacterized protein n=1 Tax=Leptolinea tardivitalis TaxID=229920 RepID=A0A0P6XIV7_9CHLR|nr:hypothetical protein [Leptolinea tardivitalis]KPL71115.1 hypothetical protein ADM99_12665 [Leptolinea tardivitalis]GAP22544.1 hypothetical protein LTAR_02776 [Leptolinea tardivitalis]
MLEPIKKTDDDLGKVKMDREALESTMKSWLIPKSTGALHPSEKVDGDSETYEFPNPLINDDEGKAS